MKDCLPWEGLHARAGQNCEEEAVAETKFYELTTTPFSPSLCTTQVEETQKLREKLSPGRCRGGEKMFYFRFVPISHYLTLLCLIYLILYYLLIGNKLNFPK